MAGNIKFSRGSSTKIDSTAIEDGQILVDYVDGKIYVDVDTNRYSISNFEVVDSIPTSPEDYTHTLYYFSNDNRFGVYKNEQWVYSQILTEEEYNKFKKSIFLNKKETSVNSDLLFDLYFGIYTDAFYVYTYTHNNPDKYSGYLSLTTQNGLDYSIIRDNGMNGPVNKVIHANNLYFTDNGCKSEDGVNFSSTSTGVEYTDSVEYCFNKFFTLGSHRQINSSVDTVTWGKIKYLDSNGRWSDIAFGNNTMIISNSEDNTLKISTDGINFIDGYSGVKSDFIQYINNYFIVYNDKIVSFSSDGNDWVTKTLNYEIYVNSKRPFFTHDNKTILFFVKDGFNIRLATTTDFSDIKVFDNISFCNPIINFINNKFVILSKPPKTEDIVAPDKILIYTGETLDTLTNVVVTIEDLLGNNISSDVKQALNLPDSYISDSDVDTKLSNYLPLSGGTMTGTVTSKSNDIVDTGNSNTLSQDTNSIYLESSTSDSVNSKIGVSKTTTEGAYIRTEKSDIDIDAVDGKCTISATNGVIINDIVKPTMDSMAAPKSYVDDAIKAASQATIAHKITLLSASWSEPTKTNEALVTGILEDETKQQINVMPTVADMSDYMSAGIWCSKQEDGKLEFTCNNIPTADINVYVSITPVTFS